jgi:two-component system NtrC family response regulator
MSHKILMIDDKLKNLGAIKGYLEIHGIEVVAMQSALAALELLKTVEFALVLLDFQMPEMSGDLVAAKIREINPLQQVAMFSCDESRAALKQSHKAGAVEFIEKNTPPDVVLGLVQSYCNRYEAICATIRPTRDKSFNAELLRSLGMVGRCETMGKVGQKIAKLGHASDITVFISGESGTGKELVAKALHLKSDRAKGPFIAVNCAAIPRDLLESELFGHVKGAFTGANEKREGKFVQADGGTIFLDEIADMPLELQAKLLRVIQERTVEPVGSRFSTKIDVRIISASHRSLDECVAAGTFREDLKFRILVADVHLPPLRERIDDLELLVGHFSAIFNEKYGRSCYFQKQTLKILKQYSWPGNVRELASVVEKHIIQSDEPAIYPENLDLKLYQSGASLAGSVTLEKYESQQGAAKLRFIMDTIEATGGNKAEAARRLGVSPAHLQYLLGQSKAAKAKENDSIKREPLRTNL